MYFSFFSCYTLNSIKHSIIRKYHTLYLYPVLSVVHDVVVGDKSAIPTQLMKNQKLTVMHWHPIQKSYSVKTTTTNHQHNHLHTLHSPKIVVHLKRVREEKKSERWKKKRLKWVLTARHQNKFSREAVLLQKSPQTKFKLLLLCILSTPQTMYYLLLYGLDMFKSTSTVIKH